MNNLQDRLRHPDRSEPRAEFLLFSPLHLHHRFRMFRSNISSRVSQISTRRTPPAGMAKTHHKNPRQILLMTCSRKLASLHALNLREPCLRSHYLLVAGSVGYYDSPASRGIPSNIVTSPG